MEKHWATKGILDEGLCWKMGKGTNISVIHDFWIPNAKNVRLLSLIPNLSDFKVVELIDSSSRTWKKKLVVSTFLEEVAEKIICIPLAEEPYDDFRAWSGEASGEYTIRSASKLLQSIEDDPRAYALQADYKKFTKSYGYSIYLQK
ncbi:hypothetical protein J1N35_038508 [Gossypium stocksii]|uniref:Uncharacterized protein n=1 Tax=Gossypium stocksii TaxID=47602 RepID=A0A9D3UMV6_9ROSI|nr:hypothetical protein J1N35_038508 [Gossypium stocksii]